MKKLVIIICIALTPVLFYGQGNSTSIPSIAQSLDQSKMNKKDCVMMKNGKMLVMKDGKTIDMPAEVKLNDGSVVLKNGTVRMPDGTTKAMKNGDSVDMDGKWEKMEKKPE